MTANVSTLARRRLLLASALPLVTGDAFFGFITTLMGALLVLALVVILVYEWDAQRSKRT